MVNCNAEQWPERRPAVIKSIPASADSSRRPEERVTTPQAAHSNVLHGESIPNTLVGLSARVPPAGSSVRQRVAIVGAALAALALLLALAGGRVP